MADKKRYDVELARAGFANGISSQLAEKFKMHQMNDISLTEQEKYVIIERAAKAFGEFLDALGVDWQNDPNSSDTPRRVAKAYVNDLWLADSILCLLSQPSLQMVTTVLYLKEIFL